MKALGRRGEELAAAYLTKHGYQVLVQNWRCERGELDLVARDGQLLVFIEVKTRRSQRHGTPAEAVDARKQEKIRHLALQYIHLTGNTAPAYRFDVVTVDGVSEQVTLIKNAF
ncbi:MAG TPA: YraN family protein [Oscillospiraceae bacterium]|nr:YraN family protein [Oscillospiraceae bacterium]